MTLQRGRDGLLARWQGRLRHAEDGGVFAYAKPGKGVQGNNYWLPKCMARDIDNCEVKEVRVQVKSDHEPALGLVQPGN